LTTKKRIKNIFHIFDFFFVLQQGKFIALNKSTLIKQLNFQPVQIQALKSTQQLQVQQALHHQQLLNQQSLQEIQTQQHQIIGSQHSQQIQIQQQAQLPDDKLKKSVAQVSPRSVATPTVAQTMILTRLPQNTIAPNMTMIGMRTPFRQKPLPLGAGTIRGAMPIISSPVGTAISYQQPQVFNLSLRENGLIDKLS
jgi:hypothetical protein